MSGRVKAIKNYNQDNEIILGELNKGDIIVCAAFGSGFLWGSSIIKW